LIEDQAVKPSRSIRANDILVVKHGPIDRTLRVKAVLEKRISAKILDDYLEELTPPEAWDALREAREQTRQNRVYRGEEGGRPTKRDRRQMDAFETREDSY
jgi:ribosome-associated heat shock protein Hsp15